MAKLSPFENPSLITDAREKLVVDSGSALKVKTRNHVSVYF